MISFLKNFRSRWQKFYINIAFQAQFLLFCFVFKTGIQNRVCKKIKTKYSEFLNTFPHILKTLFFPFALLNHLTK